MNKINYIDEDFLKLISEYSEVNKLKLEEDLSKNTDILVKIVNKISLIRRHLDKIKREYGEKWLEKYTYYGHESDIVPDNDTERKAMVKADKEILEIQESIDEYSADMDSLSDLKDIFKQKAYLMNTIVKLRMFEHGD